MRLQLLLKPIANSAKCISTRTAGQ